MTCITYRHRPFKVDGICAICNPGPQLGKLIANQELCDFYVASLAGRHCHMIGCWRAGVSDDGLGHWWCDTHQAQCDFLRLGAASGFPALVGLRAGRAAWYCAAMAEGAERLNALVGKIAGSVVMA